VVAPPAAEGIVAADGRPMNPGGKLTLCTYPNALGLPAVSVPVMRDGASGMPVGVQLVGRPGRDAEVLALAEVLERALGGFVDPEESPASALRPD
jgi:Asp-tRNA(Asn)/Glu-tRNA(Gln) amidotransferase A subunit family amidase